MAIGKSKSKSHIRGFRQGATNEHFIQTANGPVELLTTDEITKMDVDVIFVLDVTSSMSPIIEKCKKLIREFDEYLLGKIIEMNGRYCRVIRAKLITFRDFYVEKNDYALYSSDFFILVENNFSNEDGKKGLISELNKLKAVGGGDAPESALEALSIAMKSDWTLPEIDVKNRYIIILFTDADAHPLEKINECLYIPDGYPEDDVPKSLEELMDAFESDKKTRSGFCFGDSEGLYSPSSRRLVLFCPKNNTWKKWAEVSTANVTYIENDNGGKEITEEKIAKEFFASIKK
ncbi:MAG: hypothetical protein LUE12_06295 [Ruminococcus sp.]|nr:hypothetical protein [Ruminococcus sp.]